MDLLFKRYASPFLFIDGMIRSGRFVDFVDGLIETVHKEKEEQVNWDFYLHKVFEGTFNEFLDEVETNKKNRNLSERTIETTVQHSFNILNNFSPEGGV